jgi:hypothetical protein
MGYVACTETKKSSVFWSRNPAKANRLKKRNGSQINAFVEVVQDEVQCQAFVKTLLMLKECLD